MRNNLKFNNERLKQALREKKLTRAEVAKQIGISNDTFTNYRKGRLPKTEFLYNLARFFNKPMEWFITEERGGMKKMAGELKILNTENLSKVGDVSSVNSYPSNSKYIFSNFIVCSSNRLAYTASLATAEFPPLIYNPLFIYGDVGLGKTHLMCAIAHSIRENRPDMKVVYVSSEKFANELINSVVSSNLESFRQQYRYVDVLLIDDIHFLAKKEHTQEEFFHTINPLYENNKQLVISSNHPPRKLETFEKRLRSRLEAGLIVELSPPDLETRIAILHNKAIIQNLNIPDEVVTYIASRIENSIRELEGAFINVIAYASLNNRQLDVNLAAEVLQNIFLNDNVK